MSEYRGRPLTEIIEVAATRALEQFRAASELSLNAHISNAVAQTVYAGVLEVEDELEPHLSGIYAQILKEVRLQVKLRLSKEFQKSKEDPVDVASNESFPASDPPGWIWERPGR